MTTEQPIHVCRVCNALVPRVDERGLCIVHAKVQKCPWCEALYIPGFKCECVNRNWRVENTK